MKRDDMFTLRRFPVIYFRGGPRNGETKVLKGTRVPTVIDATALAHPMGMRGFYRQTTTRQEGAIVMLWIEIPVRPPKPQRPKR